MAVMKWRRTAPVRPEMLKLAIQFHNLLNSRAILVLFSAFVSTSPMLFAYIYFLY
jgi:hypothetical protein